MRFFIFLIFVLLCFVSKKYMPANSMAAKVYVKGFYMDDTDISGAESMIYTRGYVLNENGVALADIDIFSKRAGSHAKTDSCGYFSLPKNLNYGKKEDILIFDDSKGLRKTVAYTRGTSVGITRFYLSKKGIRCSKNKIAIPNPSISDKFKNWLGL